MRKLDFPLILDVLFYTVASWFLSLGLLRYYRVSTGVAVAFATLLALAVGVLAFLLIYTKRRKKVLGKKEQESRDALMLHLALERSERIRLTMLEAFTKDGKNAHCEGDALSVDGVPVVPLFTMQPVSADAVAKLIRDFGSDPFTLACNALTPEAEKLLRSFGKTAMCANEIYALYSRTDAAPATLICGEIPRKSIRNSLRRAVSKKNARPFFISGALLLIMSLFTFFPLYYLITGSVLLVSSVCIRAFGYA